MRGYPRKDGTWTFYQVESQYHHNPENGWSRFNWVDKFDTRELAESLGFVYEEVTLKASGHVWQETGIHGSTSLEYVQVLHRLCLRNVPEHSHRIVRLTVSLITTEVDI